MDYHFLHGPKEYYYLALSSKGDENLVDSISHTQRLET